MDINAAMTTATAGMIGSLGTTVTYTPAGGSDSEITCLWDDEYQELNLVSGAVSTSGPAAHCTAADVADAKKNDTVTKGAVAYTVTAVKPDGTGMTTITLHAVN